MNDARALKLTDGQADGEAPTAEPLGLAPDPVEIHRNAGLAALVGGVASAVAIAYLARATGTGAALDWLLFAVMGALGVAHLLAFVDARTPLLVADTQGVRIRLGRTWRGIPWGALARVEHRPRRGFLRDGRLVLVARNPERVLDELDASGRRQSRVAQRLYGAPFAVPLALSTRVTGAGADLTDALARLAADPSLVVEVVPEPDEVEPDEVDEDEETGDVPPPAAVILVEPHDTEVDEEEPTAVGTTPGPPSPAGSAGSPRSSSVTAQRTTPTRPSSPTPSTARRWWPAPRRARCASP